MAESAPIIGHVNPDTDTVAAATGYAWLLRERDGTGADLAECLATPERVWRALRRGA